MAHDEENPERVGYVSEPFQGLRGYRNLFVPGLPNHNPGLKLANTFGVWILFTVIQLPLSRGVKSAESVDRNLLPQNHVLPPNS